MTGTGYYTSVRDAGRTGLLLGPFAAHETARGLVPTARTLAREVDPWSDFYAFGTCKITSAGDPLPVGKLNQRAGIVIPS